MKRKAESGNVLFFILIGVVLFAALSYVVANMMRGGPTTISRERASLYADEILGYAQTIRRGVQGVRISNNCEAIDISFETPALTGYANGTNTRCQVFSAAGGGVNYNHPSTNYSDGTEVLDIGNSACHDEECTELLAILPNVNQTVCEAINDKIGISTLAANITDSYTAAKPFTGSYTYEGNVIGDAATGAGLAQKPAGCLIDGGQYHFYQVLLAR
jgi:hypothetical protein